MCFVAKQCLRLYEILRVSKKQCRFYVHIFYTFICLWHTCLILNRAVFFTCLTNHLSKVEILTVYFCLQKFIHISQKCQYKPCLHVFKVFIFPPLCTLVKFNHACGVFLLSWILFSCKARFMWLCKVVIVWDLTQWSKRLNGLEQWAQWSRANQWTGFYMITASVMKELNELLKRKA